MPEITDWRSRIDRYRFRGYKCQRCGKVFLVKRYVCRACGNTNIKPLILPRKGKIVAFSIVRQAPDTFKKYEPYPIALVELDNGKLILSQITDIMVNEIKEGIEVEATFRILYEYGRSGHIVYGTKFRPTID